MDPLGSTGRGGRFNSFQLRPQPPANGPKELRLGCQIGVTPLRAKIIVRMICGSEFNLRAAPVATRLFITGRGLWGTLNVTRSSLSASSFCHRVQGSRRGSGWPFTGSRRLRGWFERCKGGKCCWQLLAADQEGCFGGPSSLVRSVSKSTVDRTRCWFGNTPENAGRAFSESSASGTASLLGWRSSRHAGGDAQVGLSPFATRVIAFAQSAASSPDPPQGIRAVPAGEPVTGFWLPVTLEVGVAAGKLFPGRRPPASRGEVEWPPVEPAVPPKYSAWVMEIPWGEKSCQSASEPEARRGA